ncbi:MAG: hypothetical protein NWS90_06715 [Algoriphagus sp.]|nr:hypothetical protein [Algoriphagus sp.]MDP4674590.1 hypothetical protein [Flavobacteriaceae bacterium]MDP4885525.1 hypothetical protein [Flavobacteriaceae bacterium]MDP5113790.1 hypothetical protein [Flavobacteriaceae bacterium]
MKITTTQRFMMMNPVIQLIRLLVLSIKIMIVVAGGHGGTRG